MTEASYGQLEQRLRELEEKLASRTRREEETLRETRHYLENLLDYANAPIIVWDPQFRITRFNHAFERLTGKKAGEVLGTPLDILFPGNRQEEAMAHIRRTEEGERWDDVEIPIIGADGTVRTVLWNSATLYAQDDTTVVATIAQGHDITERKQAEEALRESEEKYRLLVDNADDAVLIDQDGMIKFANPKAEELFGYSEAELAKIPFTNLVYLDDRHFVLERLESGAKVRDLPGTYSFRIVNRAGEQIWGEMNTAPMSWEGRPATLMFIRDRTEQKKLEDQLRHSQRLEAIGTLAGGIAHDFNNILSAVIGNAEMALYDPQDAASVQYCLEQVHKAGHRAKDLVAQILAFSRQQEHEPKPLRLSPIVKETLKLLRASLPTTIKIRQNIRNESGPVLASPTQIHQVLMNLCTNAAHAMRENGGVLEVSLANVDNVGPDSGVAPDFDLSPRAYVELTVSDTGHGMDPIIMERMFEPYFTTKGKTEGAGLGLAVAHGIVKSHGGAINVQTEPGKGTTFHVYLPRLENDATQETGTPDRIQTGNERILFVDDEELIVDLGQRMLESLGYEVVAKTNSMEAMEIFHAKPERFDLVITDQTMPDMTGTRMAEELMRIRPDIPIILCTGYSEIITPEEVKEIGIREFVMKPLVMRNIAETIRRVLDG
ncbi:MAG: PAS domain S-box protein [Desulfobacterales bacterium]|nr:PAS domain S-box protein [Desulfobacterales bacterium]